MLATAVWLKVMTKSWQCNDFSSTKARLKLWKTKITKVTKTIKHFLLKIKTKTKSKMPAEISTDQIQTKCFTLEMLVILLRTM